VHDKFLLLCATICGLGFIYLGYFWMTALPLAAVTEHHEGSAHQEMLDEAGLGKGSEHGAEHASEHATEAPKTETAAPGGEGAPAGETSTGAETAAPHGETAPATEGGEHSSAAPGAEPAKSDVGAVGPAGSTTGAETTTTAGPGTSTGEAAH
jgi:hypothetical protein